MAPGGQRRRGQRRRPFGAPHPRCSSPTPLLLLQTHVTGWLEAFAAHPKIGDLEGLRKKYGGTFGELSRGEQAAAAGAPDAVLQVGAAFGMAAVHPVKHPALKLLPANIWHQQPILPCPAGAGAVE